MKINSDKIDLGNVRGKKGDKGNDGVGIASIEQTPSKSSQTNDEYKISTSNEYKITYTDGTTAKIIIPLSYPITNNINNVNETNSYKVMPTVKALKVVKQYLEDLIYNIHIIEVVEELPQNPRTDKIYVIYKQNDDSDGLNSTFDLYIYSNDDWQQIDSLTFDINDYYTKTEIDRDFAEKGHQHSAIDVIDPNPYSFNVGQHTQVEINQGISDALDEIREGIDIEYDTAMSDSSHNAVENRAIKSYVDTKINTATGSIVAGDTVSFTRNLTSGTKIGRLTISGNNYDLYCNNDTNTTYSAVTQSSNGLMVSGDKTSMDKSMVIAFGTSGGTASALTVTLNKNTITLTHGTIIAVYNNTANNNASATLNVNGLGAKNIYYKNSAIPSGVFPKGSTCFLMYNTTVVSGGCWQMLEFDTLYTHPSYTARTGKPTANQTPSFGGTFTLTQFTSDSTGHIDGATDRTITIPSTTASTSSNGLMSSADKSKLNGVEANANKYTHPNGTQKTGNPTGDQTPSFGGSFRVTQFTSNATGHISGATDRTITIPNTSATTSAKGLVQLDTKPTQNSTNVVSSGGLYDSLTWKKQEYISNKLSGCELWYNDYFVTVEINTTINMASTNNSNYTIFAGYTREANLDYSPASNVTAISYGGSNTTYVLLINVNPSGDLTAKILNSSGGTATSFYARATLTWRRK